MNQYVVTYGCRGEPPLRLIVRAQSLMDAQRKSKGAIPAGLSVSSISLSQ